MTLVATVRRLADMGLSRALGLMSHKTLGFCPHAAVTLTRISLFASLMLSSANHQWEMTLALQAEHPQGMCVTLPSCNARMILLDVPLRVLPGSSSQDVRVWALSSFAQKLYLFAATANQWSRWPQAAPVSTKYPTLATPATLATRTRLSVFTTLVPVQVSMPLFF